MSSPYTPPDIVPVPSAPSQTHPDNYTMPALNDLQKSSIETALTAFMSQHPQCTYVQTLNHGTAVSYSIDCSNETNIDSGAIEGFFNTHIANQGLVAFIESTNGKAVELTISQKQGL